MKSLFVILALCSLLTGAQAQRVLTITTEPNAKVWINDVYRGNTDDQGILKIKNPPKPPLRIRVRAYGFQEFVKLLNTSEREIKIKLIKTNDKAELAFQNAERIASSDKEKALELYSEAIRLRPKYAEAYVAMARILMDMGETEKALEAISNARKIKPSYPEASAVEGRIYKAEENEEKAIEAFKRAIREGKGFQPEAYAGLGLLYKERAEGFSLQGKFDQERKEYELAAKALRTSIEQLAGAPDAEVLYQMLGLIYEKQEKYAEAIKVYEEFLRVFPDSNEKSAVESFILQLKKKMN